MPRPPRPDDLYRLRIADRATPVARRALGRGHRSRPWRPASTATGTPCGSSRPTAGPRPPRQLTLGAQHDRTPVLAGRPDAGLPVGPPPVVEEEDRRRPKDGKARGRPPGPPPAARRSGEARRLTDLPRGVEAFAWSPDGQRLVVVSTSHGATHEEDRRRGRSAAEPGDRRHPTTASSTGSTTCSTARASRTTGSSTCGWSTSRPARPAA